MFKKLLIIGCGLIGSSLLRASINKKISRQILVFEKSKKYKKQIKSINSKIIIQIEFHKLELNKKIPLGSNRLIKNLILLELF